MVLGLQTSNQSIVPNVACAKISCMSTYIANLCQSLDELVFSACTTEIANEYAHVEAKPTSCRRRMELNVLESGECQAAHIRMEDGSVIDVFDDDILDVRASVQEAVHPSEKNVRSSSELQLCRVAVTVVIPAPIAQHVSMRAYIYMSCGGVRPALLLSMPEACTFPINLELLQCVTDLLLVAKGNENEATASHFQRDDLRRTSFCWTL